MRLNKCKFEYSEQKQAFCSVYSTKLNNQLSVYCTKLNNQSSVLSSTSAKMHIYKNALYFSFNFNMLLFSLNIQFEIPINTTLNSLTPTAKTRNFLFLE